MRLTSEDSVFVCVCEDKAECLVTERGREINASSGSYGKGSERFHIIIVPKKEKRGFLRLRCKLSSSEMKGLMVI